MTNIKISALTLSMFIMLFVVSESFSQGRPGRGENTKGSGRAERMEKMKEMRGERMGAGNEQCTEFRKTVIYPQMNKWKTKIDNSLTKEDLATLNKLREEAKSIKEANRETRMTQRSKGNADSSSKWDKDDFMKQRKEKSEKMQQFLSQLDPIIQRNSNVMNEIVEEYNTLVKQWYEEKKDNCSRAVPEFRRFQGNRADFQGRGKAMMGNQDLQHNEIAKYRILLNDGQEYYGDNLFDVRINIDSYISQPTSAPNPFADKAEITFEVLRAGNVQLTITDVKGESIAELHKGYLKPGKYSYIFQPDENTVSGTFLYILNYEGTLRTGKLMYQK